MKNRNNTLIKPSNDVIQICLIAERVIRTCNIFKHNIKSELYLKIKRNIYTRSNRIFVQLDDHILSQHLFNNHKYQIIAIIIYVYLDVRLHHAAKELNEKKSKLRQNLFFSVTNKQPRSTAQTGGHKY